VGARPRPRPPLAIRRTAPSTRRTSRSGWIGIDSPAPWKLQDEDIQAGKEAAAGLPRSLLVVFMPRGVRVKPLSNPCSRSLPRGSVAALGGRVTGTFEVTEARSCSPEQEHQTGHGKDSQHVEPHWRVVPQERHGEDGTGRHCRIGAEGGAPRARGSRRYPGHLPDRLEQSADCNRLRGGSVTMPPSRLLATYSSSRTDHSRLWASSASMTASSDA
jgi:hypothetical protein